MTTIRIGTALFASIADALRAARADSVVLLSSGLWSPGTLAGSSASRVSVRGSGAINGTTLANTRVFSRSADGGPPPRASPFKISASLSTPDNRATSSRPAPAAAPTTPSLQRQQG